MQFIIYSIPLGAVRCKQVDVMALSTGDIAIACPNSASPNDPVWPEIAADHHADAGIVFDVRSGLSEDEITRAEREKQKAERAAVVDAIMVTTSSGNTFDGDEVSQTRMARAIIALQATGTPTVNWVLANNSTIDASAAELVEALALAGSAQAAAWIIE